MVDEESNDFLIRVSDPTSLPLYNWSANAWTKMARSYAYTPIGEHPRRSGATGLVCSVASVAILVYVAQDSWRSSLRAGTWRSESVASDHAEASVLATDAVSLDFELYKVALSARVGDSVAIREFVNDTIALVDPNFDLGCDGVKINGYLLPYGPQLHWVESSILSNDPMPIEDWEAYFDELNVGMSQSFNAFLHNKVTMYTNDLAPPLAKLRNKSVPLLLRRSADYSGMASPVGEVAHVVFAIAGRAYELVAPIGDSLIDETREWSYWSDVECPASHRLDSDLDEYVAVYNSYVSSAEADMQHWASERGYYPPMLAFVGVAATVDDIASIQTHLFEDLASIASIEAFVETEELDRCSVYRLPTVSSKGFRAPVRYVVNPAAESMLTSRRVGDYNSYIWTVHENITASYNNWAGWDHWLDQHIGLKYVGEEPMVVAAELNKNLSAHGVPVGQRTTADYGQEKAVHWYVGYPGSMCWEYWVEGCAAYSINDEADVCACLAANNDVFFLEVRSSRFVVEATVSTGARRELHGVG